MATAATFTDRKPSIPRWDETFRATLAGIPARVAGAPFGGELVSLDWAAGDRGIDYAVCIPVNNEAERLPGVLAALSRAAARVAAQGLFVFVVNDTQDASRSLIARWAARSGAAYLLLDLTFAPPARNAPHARRLALDIAHACAPAAALLTTDADTSVGSGWIADNLAELARGAALACGSIGLDQAELRLLPAHVRAIGEAENEYFAATEALWSIWTGPDAAPLNIRASGASLGIAPAAYAALGGLPTPPAGEDRALCARMRRMGLRVVQMPAHDTLSSARLASRAAHGCGDTLRQRAREADPPCDDLLLPLSALRHLAGVWNALEAAPDRPRRFAHERQEGSRALPPMRHGAMLAELEQARRELDLLLARRDVA
ncbi:MAG: hypothetical protein KKE77_06570 [Alphaproteobacteria bacterium]|nr:hypothetical protein [Alphaproteobacteria bacterium]